MAGSQAISAWTAAAIASPNQAAKALGAQRSGSPATFQCTAILSGSRG